MTFTSPQPQAVFFADDGRIPNNRLPVLIYRRALLFRTRNPAGEMEKLFRANGWGGTWRNGIYAFPHYHSTAHEVLGVASGSASVRFGGETGETLRLEAGDVVLLPAGTGHQRIAASTDFEVVGAYPKGQKADLVRADEFSDRPQADERIRKVALPERDPVCGGEGGLTELWRQEPGR